MHGMTHYLFLYVTFFQYPGGACEIKGTLHGLTEGKHGLHILEFGDISQGSKI